ncbi:MAG: amino acid ABC transporter permease [Dehalococcoidia bacterium]
MLLAGTLDWGVIGNNLFSDLVLRGVRLTIVLTVLSMSIGAVLGTAFALLRGSRFSALRAASIGYIWLFRGTPLLVQIVFWYFALPQLWPGWAPWNGQLSSFQAGLVALSVNQGAYMTEIMRAGLLSVDPGQAEAARSLGMTAPLTMRRIVLPQAMRVVIPPVGNEFIAMLKNSSLVSVISVSELFLVAKLQYSSTLRYLEWLIIVSIWYLALTTLASVGQAWLEQRFSRGRGRGERSAGIGERMARALGRLGRREIGA